MKEEVNEATENYRADRIAEGRKLLLIIKEREQPKGELDYEVTLPKLNDEFNYIFRRG